MTTHTVAGGPTPGLMKDINAAFNSRDVDRIMTFFADDATFLMARGPEPDGRRVRGKAAIRTVLADRFKVIADMRWDHVDAFICGERAVSVWMVTGTGADGEKLNYRGCDIYERPGEPGAPSSALCAGEQILLDDRVHAPVAVHDLRHAEVHRNRHQ